LTKDISKKAVTIGFGNACNDAGNISICFDYWRNDSRLKQKRQLNFFLAVPTMLAVTVYSVFVKTWGKGTDTKRYEMILQDENHTSTFYIRKHYCLCGCTASSKTFH
jgi:undecaprenyl-diphosphatase